MKTKFNGILTLLLAFVVQLTFAQEKTISGTVVDETNMPLPGATVVIKGTTTGASTDFDGKYTITANTGDVLTFSYVGYSEQDATVATSNTIDIALALDNSLEEVVITALGVKRKSDAVTSSNQVVKAETLTQANNPDVVQGLAGKVSGLQINTTNTGLTPSTDIILRGTSSISGNNNALIVIDNVISTASTLSEIDPNNIASMNVMKGASGAALYGSRGGNGVVIVTTKKGTDNNTKFTVDIKSSMTFEEIAYTPQRQDRFGQGWEGDLDWTDQGAWGPEFDGSNQTVGIPYPGATDWRFHNYNHIEDHLDPFFDTGITYQNSVSLAAGDKDGYINFSANKQKIEGIIPGNEYRKDFFNLNASKTAGRWTVGTVIRYMTDETDRTANGTYASLSQTPTNVNITDFSSGAFRDHWTLYATSPYWNLKNRRAVTNANRVEAQADLKYDFNEHINVVLRSSVNSLESNSLSYNNGFIDTVQTLGTDRSETSRFDKSKSTFRQLYTDLLFNFDYNLTDDIHFTSLVGANLSETKTDLVGLGGENITIPGLYSIGNIDGEPDNKTQDESLQRGASAYIAPSFDYKDYLFLNLTGRYEETSVLSKENRGFFYYGGGLSFVPTKAFPSIKGKAIQKLKLSASYTLTGNASVSPYSINYRAGQAAGFPFTGNSFVASSAAADADLVNEDVYTAEFNLNADLLRINNTSRVTLDFAYYNQTNENQILNTTVSSASGLTNAIINVGETETTGLEFDLGLVPVKTDNFKWDLNVGYATSETMVNKVTDQSDEVLLRNSGTAGIYAIKGQEFPLIKGSAYTRDDQGRVVLDSNGNPIIDSELKVLGKVTPDYSINFATGVTYKNFRLNAVMDYRTGHSFYSGIASNLTQIGGTIESAQNGREAFLFPNSTIEGSGVANTTVLTGGNSPAQFQSYIQDNYGAIDENFVLDATAVKLRELSITYDLPTKMLKNTFLTKLRVGASGRNLYTWLPRENREYNDPEIGTGLSGYGQTPPTRAYTMSLNLIF